AVYFVVQHWCNLLGRLYVSNHIENPLRALQIKHHSSFMWIIESSFLSKYVQVNPYSYVQQDRKKEIKSCYTRYKQFTLTDRYLKQPAYSAKSLINNESKSILVKF
ncbi:hypothetical protein, partial [Acinetobacter baumannii]